MFNEQQTKKKVNEYIKEFNSLDNQLIENIDISSKKTRDLPLQNRSLFQDKTTILNTNIEAENQ